MPESTLDEAAIRRIVQEEIAKLFADWTDDPKAATLPNTGETPNKDQLAKSA